MPGNELRLDISIHALRKESDAHQRVFAGHHVISIHALRKESDLDRTMNDGNQSYFNLRSP